MWPIGICRTSPGVKPWVKGESVGLGAEVDLLADVVQAGVAHQRAGQQAGLAQDLEAIADAEHQAAGAGKLLHRLHDRGEARDGAGAQVIAIGEAAGDQDGVAALEVFRGMPEIGHWLPSDCVDDVVGVVVAVGAGEDQNAEFHRPSSHPGTGDRA